MTPPLDEAPAARGDLAHLGVGAEGPERVERGCGRRHRLGRPPAGCDAIDERQRVAGPAIDPVAVRGVGGEVDERLGAREVHQGAEQLGGRAGSIGVAVNEDRAR